MNLKSFQALFLNSVSKVDQLEVCRHIKPGGTLNAEQAMSVYRSDYYARLSEALGEHYESVWFVVGDEEFSALTRLYIDSYPSSVRDLGSYGKEFSEFLSTQEISREFPFLSDLAKFESYFWSVFHSEGLEPYDPFETVDPVLFGNTRWSLPVKSSLFSWNWNIVDIFRAREGKADDVDLDIDRPAACLIIKIMDKVKIFNLSPSQFEIMTGLNTGKSISQALTGEANEVQELFALLRQQRIPLLSRNEGAS